MLTEFRVAHVLASMPGGSDTAQWTAELFSGSGAAGEDTDLGVVLGFNRERRMVHRTCPHYYRSDVKAITKEERIGLTKFVLSEWFENLSV